MFTHNGWQLPLGDHRNNGMLEIWNIGPKNQDVLNSIYGQQSFEDEMKFRPPGIPTFP